jgi:capsular polysaccharide biosynthesis protein
MEELDLKEIFSMFWSKRKLICIIVAIAIVIGIVYTFAFVTPKYQASTTLVLTQADTTEQTDTTQTQNGIITNQDVTLNSNLIATYTDIFTSDKVINQVVEKLENDGITGLDKEEIKNNVKVSIKNEDSNVLIMTITNKDSKKAMQIANELASIGIVEINQYFNSINNIKILDEATENTEPSNINHVRDILIFAIVGMVIAFGYVLITYMMDNTVKSAEDIEKSCKTLVLASIPLYDSKKGGKK